MSCRPLTIADVKEAADLVDRLADDVRQLRAAVHHLDLVRRGWARIESPEPIQDIAELQRAVVARLEQREESHARMRAQCRPIFTRIIPELDATRPRARARALREQLVRVVQEDAQC